MCRRYSRDPDGLASLDLDRLGAEAERAHVHHPAGMVADGQPDKDPEGLLDLVLDDDLRSGLTIRRAWDAQVTIPIGKGR